MGGRVERTRWREVGVILIGGWLGLAVLSVQGDDEEPSKDAESSEDPQASMQVFAVAPGGEKIAEPKAFRTRRLRRIIFRWSDLQKELDLSPVQFLEFEKAAAAFAEKVTGMAQENLKEDYLRMAVIDPKAGNFALWFPAFPKLAAEKGKFISEIVLQFGEESGSPVRMAIREGIFGNWGQSAMRILVQFEQDGAFRASYDEKQANGSGGSSGSYYNFALNAGPVLDLPAIYYSNRR
jgi:hypothetical protein